jgi:hypothetical protein
MNARRHIILLGTIAAVAASAALAQPFRGTGSRADPYGDNEPTGPWVRIEGNTVINEETVRTARETASHSSGTPEWENPRGFEKDVFTFARIFFKTGVGGGTGWGRGRRFGWWVDYPDADLNFSYRLQQLTTMRTDPDCRVLRLTDPSLTDYPVIYMEHCGYIQFRDGEVDALQKYLRNGGALFVNDFWSQTDWDGFEAAMKRVLPGRTWTELTMAHPIFHCVFDLKGPMKSLQVPTMQFWNRQHERNPGVPLQFMYRGEGSDDVHVRAWLDDKGRIMVVAIHNSDVSDGWEREGENDDYFHTFSEKVAYPLGINIVFYLMTH